MWHSLPPDDLIWTEDMIHSSLWAVCHLHQYGTPWVTDSRALYGSPWITELKSRIWGPSVSLNYWTLSSNIRRDVLFILLNSIFRVQGDGSFCVLESLVVLPDRGIFHIMGVVWEFCFWRGNSVGNWNSFGNWSVRDIFINEMVLIGGLELSVSVKGRAIINIVKAYFTERICDVWYIDCRDETNTFFTIHWSGSIKTDPTMGLSH